MANSDRSPDRKSGANTTVLDDYFMEVAKSPDHRYEVSMRVWDTLMPADRLALQRTAVAMAEGDLATSAKHARSLLLVEHVNRQALAALIDMPVLEATDSIV